MEHLKVYHLVELLRRKMRSFISIQKSVDRRFYGENKPYP